MASTLATNEQIENMLGSTFTVNSAGLDLFITNMDGVMVEQIGPHPIVNADDPIEVQQQVQRNRSSRLIGLVRLIKLELVYMGIVGGKQGKPRILNASPTNYIAERNSILLSIETVGVY